MVASSYNVGRPGEGQSTVVHYRYERMGVRTNADALRLNNGMGMYPGDDASTFPTGNLTMPKNLYMPIRPFTSRNFRERYKAK